jgi:hypothetical protein
MATNPVEAQMVAFIQRRVAEGAASVTRSEVLAAVIPHEHPEYRYRPEYKQALERLHHHRRIRAIRDKDGQMRYFFDGD